jgi:hypothetical protein
MENNSEFIKKLREASDQSIIECILAVPKELEKIKHGQEKIIQQMKSMLEISKQFEKEIYHADTGILAKIDKQNKNIDVMNEKIRGMKKLTAVIWSIIVAAISLLYTTLLGKK